MHFTTKTSSGIYSILPKFFLNIHLTTNQCSKQRARHLLPIPRQQHPKAAFHFNTSLSTRRLRPSSSSFPLRPKGGELGPSSKDARPETSDPRSAALAPAMTVDDDAGTRRSRAMNAVRSWLMPERRFQRLPESLVRSLRRRPARVKRTKSMVIAGDGEKRKSGKAVARRRRRKVRRCCEIVAAVVKRGAGGARWVLCNCCVVARGSRWERVGGVFRLCLFC